MPAPANNKTIPHFFKPYAKPRSRIPVNDVVEEEIIVAARPSQSETIRPKDASSTPTKRHGSEGSDTSPAGFRDTPPTSRRLPIGTPRKTNHATQLHGSADLKPNVSGPNSSQTRTLMAVEISPPSISRPPTQLPNEVPDRAASASFSSISTLSSVPMSSSSSSRRVMKGGMKAVTNSDSGSADSDTDELADPIVFVPRKRQKLTPPGEDATHAIEIVDSAQPSRTSGRSSDTDRRSNGRYTPRMAPSPPQNVYKHSLLKLVKQREKEEKTAARIKEAQAEFEEAQRQREERLKQDQNLSNGLKAATADDSDEGDRMRLAMQRTEALQEEERFYYFRGRISTEPIEFPSLFKPGGEPLQPWMKILQNEQSRTHAFLSGFVADMAQKEPLTPRLHEWIANQLMLETRTDLCEAYSAVLKASYSQPSNWQGEFLKFDYFHDTIDELDDDALEDHATIPNSQPTGLPYVLRILQVICTNRRLLSDAGASLIVSLSLAGADQHIKDDAELMTDLHDTIGTALDAFPGAEDFDATCKRVHQAFFARGYLSQYLRCRVISSLPAASERAHHLRRALALHLIADFTRTEDYRIDPISSDWVAIILNRLRSAPEFNIAQILNYSLFDSLVGILDIAIDAGFADCGLPSSVPTPAKPKAFLNGPSGTPSAESSFNSQIDALTQQLLHMSSQIRGSGTSHLRRTEAKASLDRLIVRLENGVRTKAKPRKGIFGDATSAQQRAFLSGFLKPISTDRDAEDDGVSVSPADVLNDRKIGGGNQTSEESSAVSGAESR